MTLVYLIIGVVSTWFSGYAFHRRELKSSAVFAFIGIYTIICCIALDIAWVYG
jgi:hypothetical protein